MDIVETRDLACRLDDGTVLLDAIDLSVRPGECILLCGRSGMGKTTITKCLNGLIPVFDTMIKRMGQVRVCGVDPAECEMHKLARHVGSVFQNPKSQFFNLTSNDELAFGLEAAGVDADEIERSVRRVVSDLGIQRLLNRSVTTMSGGERQSLVFASVAVVDPDLYVLDEPTANLDAAATRALHDEIAAVLARGKTVVVAEHRLHFLADLIDRALVVDEGRIVERFTAAELRALSRAEREALGLRAFNPEELALPEALADAGRSAAAPLKEGLSVRGFTVRKGKVDVLRGVGFDAPRGSVVGIVGANGSGKTTLLRAVAGLERSCEGNVLFDGASLSRKARRRTCSLVMQDVNHQLFADSVWAECELSVLARDERERTKAIADMLAELGLTGLETRHPMALSGGQKQRLAVACALLAERDVLLLDEPTSGLDLEHMIEVAGLVRSVAERGVSVIVVTHDNEFLQRACDRVLRIA